MKRRIFLKTGTVGIGGLMVMPAFVYGCQTVTPVGPAKGLSLFQDGARLFDSSIAELRMAGSGELSSAEAEDVELAGINAQIAEQQATMPAELAENFAQYSLEMLDSTNTLVEAAPHIHKLETAEQAELAEDYALLKVVKASTLLAAAAAETPIPERKVSAGEKMVQSAEFVHSSVLAGAEAEIIESTGELHAHAEEYVGSAETYTGGEAYIEGAEEFAEAVDHMFAERHGFGAADLMTSSDNIALSSGYFAEGIECLNAEAEFFNQAEANSAAELIPSSEHILAETNRLFSIAQGESAELGAAEMRLGASEMVADAESNVSHLGVGGEILDVGADQFIAGTTTFLAAEKHNYHAEGLLSAAEDIEWRPYYAEQRIKMHAEMLLPAAENFLAGAEALQKIELTEGVESLVPSTTELLASAEHLESFAESSESIAGAELLIQGAEMAEHGAIESLTNPAESLEDGAKHVEFGSFEIMSGAAEFIEGYN